MHHPLFQHPTSIINNMHCIIDMHCQNPFWTTSIMQQQTITCNNIQQYATTYNSIQQNRTNNNQPLRVMKNMIASFHYTPKLTDNQHQQQMTNENNKQQSTINHLVAINMITYHQCCILANATLAGKNVIWHNLCWFTYNNQPLSGTNMNNVYC